MVVVVMVVVVLLVLLELKVLFGNLLAIYVN